MSMRPTASGPPRMLQRSAIKPPESALLRLMVPAAPLIGTRKPCEANPVYVWYVSAKE